MTGLDPAAEVAGRRPCRLRGGGRRLEHARHAVASIEMSDERPSHRPVSSRSVASVRHLQKPDVSADSQQFGRGIGAICTGRLQLLGL